MQEPSIIERSAEKARIWIEEIAAQMGTDDHRLAFRVMRAYLQPILG